LQPSKTFLASFSDISKIGIMMQIRYLYHLINVFLLISFHPDFLAAFQQNEFLLYGPKMKLQSQSLRMSAVSDSTESKSNTHNKAPTLPSQEFRPKQSLGQNYLSDMNYIMKIVDVLIDDSKEGSRVVEVGPGAGALTEQLVKRYPDMTAVEIDQRSVELLKERIPEVRVVHSDCLQVNWPAFAKFRGGRLSVIGNLPYHITSQILFTLADSHQFIRQACVTMQYEVAQRICAKPGTKDYGILSVVFQLYSRPQIMFKIPPSVFYPKPKVDSAMMKVDFAGKKPPQGVKRSDLRQVLKTTFQQRRKMLRQSLKPLLKEHPGVELPEEFATKRPQHLTPEDFVELTKVIFGEQKDTVGDKAWRNVHHGEY